MEQINISNLAKTGGRVYTTIGNVEVHESDPGFRIIDLRSVRPSSRDNLSRQPSRLLAEIGHLVRFHGRGEELRRLRAWRDATAPFGVTLIHGAGGQGKTRLAGHFAEQSVIDGWTVLGARLHRPGVDPEVRLAQTPTGVQGRLLVIDYAERWPVELLRSVLLYRPLHDGKPTRIVLLARPAGDWWRRVSHLLRNHLAVEPMQLPLDPLPVDANDRQLVFSDAFDIYARELGVHEGAPPPPPVWSADATALELHMAALAAAFALARRDQPPAKPDALSAYLLDREYEHWAQLHERRLIKTRPQAMARVVYLACLAGPLLHAEASALVVATGLAIHGEETMRLLDEHALSYPTSVLAPLQPDRIAEDFVALLAADPWTASMPTTILETLVEVAPERVPVFLLMLVAVADRWDNFLQQQLVPLLRKHAAEITAVGGPFLQALATMASLDVATLSAVEAAMPVDGSPNLMDPLAALTSQLYRKMLACHSAADLVVPVAYRLARRLARTGRYEEAQEPINRAIAHWRREPGHSERLASAWFCHAEILAGQGRLEAALTSAEHAIHGWPPDLPPTMEYTAYRDLYAQLLHRSGRSPEAADYQRATGKIWRTLSASAPAAQVSLARSLNAEATYMRAAARSVDAAKIAVEAARLWTALDRETPDGRHRDTLIAVYTTLAASSHAPTSARLTAGEQAVRILMSIWKLDITYAAPTVHALCAYSAALRSAERHRHARKQAASALAIASELDQGSQRNRLLLARSLTAFAWSCLADGSDLDSGREAARKAEQIFTAAGRLAEARTAFKIITDLLAATASPATPTPAKATPTPKPVARPSKSKGIRTCPMCSGSGTERRESWGRDTTYTRKCSRCDGKGHVSARFER